MRRLNSQGCLLTPTGMLYTNAYSSTRAQTHTHTLTYRHTHLQVHTLTHIHMQAHTHMHKLKQNFHRSRFIEYHFDEQCHPILCWLTEKRIWTEWWQECDGLYLWVIYFHGTALSPHKSFKLFHVFIKNWNSKTLWTLEPMEESLKIMYFKWQKNGYSNFKNHNYYLIASVQLWGLVLVKL